MNSSVVTKEINPRLPAPKVNIIDGVLSPDLDEHASVEGFVQSAMAATGTRSRELAIVLVEQLIKAFGEPTEASLPFINASLAALSEQEPRNATEALLITQMSAIHVNLMNLLARAASTSLGELQKNYTNTAMKLARVFTTQAETLRRIRQKGRQTISVHHVHLNNENGQAIIGNVSQASRKGVKKI